MHAHIAVNLNTVVLINAKMLKFQNAQQYDRNNKLTHPIKKSRSLSYGNKHKDSGLTDQSESPSHSAMTANLIIRTQK